MIEIWKNIQGYENKYQVSNLGNIKTIKEWVGNKHCSKYKQCDKLLIPVKDNAGYYCVSLWKNSKSKTHRIHVEVAKSFLSNPDNLPCVNHKDGNKQNNNVDNLEWCTFKHNSQEAVKLGLSKPNYIGIMKGKFGKEHNKSKKVKQIDVNTGEIINIFFGIEEASRQTGICSSNISACCNKKIRNKGKYYWQVKTAGGYKWEYC